MDFNDLLRKGRFTPLELALHLLYTNRELPGGGKDCVGTTVMSLVRFADEAGLALGDLPYTLETFCSVTGHSIYSDDVGRIQRQIVEIKSWTYARARIEARNAMRAQDRQHAEGLSDYGPALKRIGIMHGLLVQQDASTEAREGDLDVRSRLMWLQVQMVGTMSATIASLDSCIAAPGQALPPRVYQRQLLARLDDELAKAISRYEDRMYRTKTAYRLLQAVVRAFSY